MSITSNLKKVVDLPVWEWTRFAPVAPSAGLSCSCTADNNVINETNGRFIYYLINATNFWRYDTISDSYMQLATPPNAPLTASTMRFAGALGFHNRVLSATSNTLRTGLPTGKSAIGFKIRIVSGTGAGQERIITDVSDPIIADFGNATAGSTTSLTDASKNWYGSAASANDPVTNAFSLGIANVNGWAGYVIRMIPFGTGPNQVRRILYNTNQIITIGDINVNTYEPFSNTSWVAPAAGSLYQIESSIVTVDTPWDVVPDQTSRFIIRSGAILLLSGASAAPFHTMQYYCVLADMWYALPGIQNITLVAPTDNSLERTTENSTIWYRGTATTGTTTTLVDTSANWTTNEWAGYEMFIFSGNGRGQIVQIGSNTSDTLTFPSLTGAPDSTSKYEILGFDAGISTGSNAYNTIVDSTKSWSADRWKNYAVRILYGKGAGQMRRILSNTSTTLTLYRAWNVQPDNTSVYSIQGDSETMHFTWGASAQHFQYSTMGGINMAHIGRSRDFGAASILAALRSDANHNIEDVCPIALTSLAGTTTITGTSVQPHLLKVGDWVSIRGVTGSGDNQFNVNGLVQVTGVPSTTAFTYIPTVSGNGTYTYLPALSTTNLSDASKEYRDNAISGTNTSVTFSRITPSNINGWYAQGANIIPGVRVTSGAGTSTVYLSDGSGTPTGVIVFSAWGPAIPITNTVLSGGGVTNPVITMTGANNPNINGWLAVGTGIALNTFVASGAGSANLTLTNACTGVTTGTITFYPPEVANKVFIITTAAPAITTANTTSQLVVGISPTGGGSIGFLAPITLPVAAVSKYIVTDLPIIGANFDGSTSNYVSGIATGGTTTTLVDANAFWINVTGTASSGSTTLSLSTTAPANVNGWYINGASGILIGTRVISGAGTTTLTLNTPVTGVFSGLIACCAWGPSGQGSHLVGKRIRVLTGTGAQQELAITAVTPAAGTLTFATATAPALFSAYTIVSTPLKGAGHELSWVYGNHGIHAEDRGRYLWAARGGAAVGIDKIDITTDKVIYVHTTPFTETLGAGTFYAYDGLDKIYFTKDVTQRVYCLDVNTAYICGGGTIPYSAGTAGIGNKMEIFQTADRLNYIWVNRHANVEHFRALLYW